MARQPSGKSKAEIVDATNAALAANIEIQEGVLGGLVKASDPMNPPQIGGHYVPYSVGAGDASFQDSNQNKVVQTLKEADAAYRQVGVVRNVVDIMTDFTSAGLNVHHPIAAQERFYRAWLNKVNMEEVAKQSLRGMYKWANIGIWRFWGKIRPKTKKEMMAKARELFKEGKDDEAVKAFFREDKTIKVGRIPVRYSCIPPFLVRITGSLLFDTRYYTYCLPECDKNKILNPEKYANEFEKKLLLELPDSVKLHVQRDSYIVLPNENFTMLHYKRDCSRLWADPIILPIMNDLRYKQVLRRLDISVAESIINPITIFKLGKTVEGFGPTPQQFQNLATLLKTPVATKTLVWSDLIEVEQHVTDATEVFSTEKYKEVDADILAGLGVSQVLISGGSSSSSFGNAFLSVRTLLERLEDGRQEFMKFLNKELDYVRLAMGWKKSPVITWDQMNLRDEAAEKRIIVELVDRKIISAESALDALGFDSTIEMSRKIREQKLAQKSGVAVSVGPFEESVRVQQDKDPAKLGVEVQNKQLDMQREMQEKDINIRKQEVKNNSAPRAGPGRPADKGDPSSRKQKVSRETKPAGMGSYDQTVIAKVHFYRKHIEDYIKPLFLKSLDKTNLRNVTKAEKLTYDQLVRSILNFANPYLESSLSDEWIADTALDIANGQEFLTTSYGSTVNSIYKDLMLDYKTVENKPPDINSQNDLFAKALVLFYDGYPK
jgi:hypothetical protein